MGKLGINNTMWQQTNTEKDDPLKRIQEEINEVARREREVREKNSQLLTPNEEAVPSLLASPTMGSAAQKDTIIKEQLDDTLSGHSDDSGFSTASSPINGTSSNRPATKFNRQNGFSKMSALPPQKVLTRAQSTPHIFSGPPPRLAFGSVQKGIMQRFIASRGKLGSNNGGNKILTSTNLNRPPTFANVEPASPAVIERDQDGRPIRRGFVPVEEKIQKELRDLKTRECELKRLRRLRKTKSAPNGHGSIDSLVESEEIGSHDEESDIEDDTDEGFYTTTNKLRSSKSIGELCDALNNMSSLSPRETPSPSFEPRMGNGRLRPAVSLAQLCDLSPNEAPSSHRLIAQWETIIQQNQ